MSRCNICGREYPPHEWQLACDDATYICSDCYHAFEYVKKKYEEEKRALMSEIWELRQNIKKAYDWFDLSLCDKSQLRAIRGSYKQVYSTMEDVWKEREENVNEE